MTRRRKDGAEEEHSSITHHMLPAKSAKADIRPKESNLDYN